MISSYLSIPCLQWHDVERLTISDLQGDLEGAKCRWNDCRFRLPYNQIKWSSWSDLDPVKGWAGLSLDFKLPSCSHSAPRFVYLYLQTTCVDWAAHSSRVHYTLFIFSRQLSHISLSGLEFLFSSKMSTTALTNPAPEWVLTYVGFKGFTWLYWSSYSWLNKGDQAWQLTAGTLVALQSIPGLAILYAGFVKK